MACPASPRRRRRKVRHGDGGSGGDGVTSEEVSPRDCRASPGRLPRVPWAPAPSLPATCQGFDSQPSPPFFSSSVCQSRRARQAGRQHFVAQPCLPSPVPGEKPTSSRQNHPRGVQRPQRGIALAAGIWGTGVGRCYATLWYYSGFISLRPRPAPPALPLLLLCARRWRGREVARSRRDIPSIPTSHFSQRPDDLV